MYSLWAFIAATGQRRSQPLHDLVVLLLFESGLAAQPFVASRAVAIVGVVDDDEAGSVSAAGLVQVASDFKSAVGGQESAPSVGCAAADLNLVVPVDGIHLSPMVWCVFVKSFSSLRRGLCAVHRRRRSSRPSPPGAAVPGIRYRSAET